MIEYPSIDSSAKSPRKHCIAFDKLDGSNFRAKWTPKASFCSFGTRTQQIDESTPEWGEMVYVFKNTLADPLHDKFKRDKDYRDYREITIYGEFFGDQSFAGRHVQSDPKQIVLFDVLLGHKNRKFVHPTDFIKDFQEIVKIPDIIYVGNLNQEFIQQVRDNAFNLKEGVICKGTEPTGAAMGGIWKCKIKTSAYFEKLKEVYNTDWKRYWE